MSMRVMSRRPMRPLPSRKGWPRSGSGRGLSPVAAAAWWHRVCRSNAPWGLFSIVGLALSNSGIIQPALRNSTECNRSTISNVPDLRGWSGLEWVRYVLPCHRASATVRFVRRIVQFSLVTCTTQKRLPSGSSNTMKSSSGLYLRGYLVAPISTSLSTSPSWSVV